LRKDTRSLFEVFGVDDDFRGQTRSLIDLFFHRYGFSDVAELDLTPHFRENRNRVGVPFSQKLTCFDFCSVFLFELRAIHDRVALPFSLSALLTLRIIDNGDFTVSIHHHQVAFLIGDRAHVDKFYKAVVAGL